MRQAGRILPEYRAIRNALPDFKSLVTNPELASEVTVQPVDLLNVDAAIIFSDILVIPEAMGLDYEMIEKVGPRFPRTIATRQDIDRLRSGDEAAEHLEYVYQAIRLTHEKLRERVPLIGFSGAPFTLLAYMVEGKGSKTFSKAKSFLYSHSAEAHGLLEKLTDTIIAYLKRKAEAGANLVQVFDSWAGVLDQQLYRDFSLRYIKEICRALAPVPVIVFAKGAWFALEDLAKIPQVAIGLDWQTEPGFARKVFGQERILQGNLDPSCLLSPEANIRSHTKRMLDTFGQHHIANLGHGVYPETSVDAVKAFIDEVKTYRYHT
jgi:uroporphyrinogen decarboxylase